MAKIEDREAKEDLIKRLRTIKGHIGGIEKMIDRDKDCVDLLIQISAVKSSINKIGLSLIKNNASECIIKAVEKNGELEESIEEAIDTILKFSK